MSSPTFKSSAQGGFLALLLAFAPDAHAQTPLPDWDQLGSAQREHLTAPTRDRWNSATPEQRARMLTRAERWQQMAPDERARVSGTIGRWQNLPPGQRHELHALFRHLRTLDAPARDAFMARWTAMTPQQRQEWAEANPAPPREGPSRRHRGRAFELPSGKEP